MGDKILEANSRIKLFADSIRLFTGALIVETPRRPNLAWLDYLSNYAAKIKDGTHMVKLPLRFLRINDNIAIWSAPLELFCEISNEVRDRSPFPYTFYYGYTNGWLGYLPSESEWKYGGYEVEMVSPFTQEASSRVTESVVGYLEGEMRNHVATPKSKSEIQRAKRQRNR